MDDIMYSLNCYQNLKSLRFMHCQRVIHDDNGLKNSQSGIKTQSFGKSRILFESLLIWPKKL